MIALVTDSGANAVLVLQNKPPKKEMLMKFLKFLTLGLISLMGCAQSYSLRIENKTNKKLIVVSYAQNIFSQKLANNYIVDVKQQVVIEEKTILPSQTANITLDRAVEDNTVSISQSDDARNYISIQKQMWLGKNEWRAVTGLGSMSAECIFAGQDPHCIIK